MGDGIEPIRVPLGDDPGPTAPPPAGMRLPRTSWWRRGWCALRSSERVYSAHETIRMRELEGLRLASFPRRAGAFLIDFVAAALLFVAVAIPGALLWERTHPGYTAHIVFTPFGTEGGNWYSVAFLSAYFSLSVYFTNGLTLGKRLCRLRILSTVHERISLWHAFERALGYGVSAAELGLGFLQYFTASNCRTTHDRIAETIVVFTERPESTGEELRDSARAG
jgi:uncharacterized RDD family membrane protein YckC